MTATEPILPKLHRTALASRGPSPYGFRARSSAAARNDDGFM